MVESEMEPMGEASVTAPGPAEASSGMNKAVVIQQTSIHVCLKSLFTPIYLLSDHTQSCARIHGSKFKRVESISNSISMLLEVYT